MFKKNIVILIALLTFNISHICLANFSNSFVPKTYKVALWKRVDIQLVSKKNYKNPFLDVSIDAVFTHRKSGKTISIPGFWNGDSRWVVRFAPTETGEWKYKIKCSDAGNASLTQEGEIQALKAEGKTLLAKHGFVKMAANKRFFTYDDGKPFFWLGDTHWQAPDYERTDKCNDPDCDLSCGGSQFRHLLNNRLAKGFNVYQTYPDAAETDGGGNLRRFNWWEDHTKLLISPESIKVNPSAFTENFDVMMNELSQKGMTIVLGFGVHQSTADAMHQESLLRWARYMVARYAAYPVIWITAQEINALPGTGSYDKWCKVAALINELDGYQHPLSAHTDRDYVGKTPGFNEMKDFPWHGFWAMQGGHLKDNSAENQTQDYYKKYWFATPRKPYIETEANYEQLYWPEPINEDRVRETAWRAVQSGSYGYTYGASGIWAMNWEAGDGRGWETWSKLSWHQAKDLPGSFQMGYMKSFYESLNFEQLEPRFDDDNYVADIDVNKSFLSSLSNNVYVLYVSAGSKNQGKLKGLDVQSRYSANWFNPRNGTYHLKQAQQVLADKTGTHVIPEKPDQGDWVYLLNKNGKK